MNLAQFTESMLLVPRLISRHRESAIIELGKRLDLAGRVESAETFTNAVLEHERMASAEFGGVAFPLARGPAAKQLSFALGLASQPIRWGVGQAPIVHAVALFAVPLSEGERYLSLLLTFSSFIKNELGFTGLRRCIQPEEMLIVLSRVSVVRTGNAASDVGGTQTGRDT